MNQSKQTKSKGNIRTRLFFKNNIGYILLVLSLLVVTTVVILAVVLGNRPAVIPDDLDPVINTPITYGLPVSEYTVGQEASLTKPVFNSTLKKYSTHNGMDFMCAAGTEVVAVMDGTVKSITSNVLEGTVVTIEHAEGIVSIYKSLAEENTLTVGAAIKKGDTVGTVADSSLFELHEGAHLHFEMKKNGEFVNPVNYIDDLSDK